MKNIVVAIDGFSSCGKSTMAKWLAKEVAPIVAPAFANNAGAATSEI